MCKFKAISFLFDFNEVIQISRCPCGCRCVLNLIISCIKEIKVTNDKIYAVVNKIHVGSLFGTQEPNS